MSIEDIALLAPKTCRFDIGRGGLPVLQSIDRAGALGMGPQLGALVLELIVLRRGPETRFQRACELAGDLLRDEAERLRDARLDAELAEFLGDGSAGRTLDPWQCSVTRLRQIGRVAILAMTDEAGCWQCARKPRTALERRIVGARGLPAGGADISSITGRLVARVQSESFKARVIAAARATVSGMVAGGAYYLEGDRLHALCPECRGTGESPFDERKLRRTLGRMTVSDYGALRWITGIIDSETRRARWAYDEALGR